MEDPKALKAAGKKVGMIWDGCFGASCNFEKSDVKLCEFVFREVLELRASARQ